MEMIGRAKVVLLISELSPLTEKFNPHHDAKTGKFSSTLGSTSSQLTESETFTVSDYLYDILKREGGGRVHEDGAYYWSSADGLKTERGARKVAEKLAEDLRSHGFEVSVSTALEYGYYSPVLAIRRGKGDLAALKKQIDDKYNKIDAENDVSVVHEKIPGWKPVMSRAEADAWAADSVYRDTVYHATDPENAKMIRKDGFLDSGGGGFGEDYGRGMFFSTDRKSVTFYETNGTRGESVQNEVLNVRLNVRKVLSLDHNVDRKILSGDETDYGVGIARKMGVPNPKKVYQRLYDASQESGDMNPAAGAVRLLAIRNGYDAIKIREGDGVDGSDKGGNQIIVFNPQRVTIVRGG
jgi:hypothetical protein